MDLNGVLSFIPFYLLGCFHTAVGTAFAAKFFCITVEDLFIFSCKWYAQAEFLMIHIIKVTYTEQSFFFASAQEYDHAFLMVAAVDPLKAFRIKVLLIQCRMGLIQLV